MISISVKNELSDEKGREQFIRMIKKSGAGRVFLLPGRAFSDRSLMEKKCSKIKESIGFYRNYGLEAGIWIGGFGHGGVLSDRNRVLTSGWTRIADLVSGETSDDSFCPLDDRFRRSYMEFLNLLAGTGPDLIMIDDDFRICMHAPAGIACACDRHIDQFNIRAKAAGLANDYLTREDLAAELFTGRPTPLRKVWMDLMGDTLRNFAVEAREAVDRADPSIRLGLCACMSTWDTDGTDAIELSRILAGRTRPFLRLIGAPYWNDYNTDGQGAVISFERMQAAWCRENAPEIELMSEGDVCPRFRYRTPSLFLESFSEILTADGLPDILKYMFSYDTYPEYETGYCRHHILAASEKNEIADAFRGTRSAGVFVFEHMHTALDRDYTGFIPWDVSTRLLPPSAKFSNVLGIPVSFERTEFTKVALISGENAKYAADAICRMPLILDFEAARILTERGYDVGLRDFERIPAPEKEIFEKNLAFDPGEKARYYSVTPAESAEITSTFDGKYPSAYRYVRSDGEYAIVYAFDFELSDLDFSDLYLSYSRQSQLFDWVPEIPVRIRKEHGAYVLCRENEDILCVGIWNLGRDVLIPEEICLADSFLSLENISGIKACFSDNKAYLMDRVYPGQHSVFILRKR